MTMNVKAGTSEKAKLQLQKAKTVFAALLSNLGPMLSKLKSLLLTAQARLVEKWQGSADQRAELMARAEIYWRHLCENAKTAGKWSLARAREIAKKGREKYAEQMEKIEARLQASAAQSSSGQSSLSKTGAASVSAASGDRRVYLIAGGALALVGLLILMFAGDGEEVSPRRSSSRFTSATLSSDQYIYYDSEVRLPPGRASTPENGFNSYDSSFPPSTAGGSKSEDGIPAFAKSGSTDDGVQGGGHGKDGQDSYGGGKTGADDQQQGSQDYGKDAPSFDSGGYNDTGYGDGGYNEWNGGSGGESYSDF